MRLKSIKMKEKSTDALYLKSIRSHYVAPSTILLANRLAKEVEEKMFILKLEAAARREILNT